MIPNREVWRPIPDLPYEASTHGRIRHSGTKKFPKAFRLQRRHGYLGVNLNRDGWTKVFAVHRLVALTFHGERPEGYDTDHVDGNRDNNRPDNLEYVTHAENMRRSKHVRRGANHPGTLRCGITEAVVREIRALEQRGPINCKALMAQYGIERKTLYNIRKRVTWAHIE